MGYIATDLARVPADGFSWYVFLLEDHWESDLGNELADNFINLAREVGPDALVVKGAEPRDFYNQVFDQYVLQERGHEKGRVALPALLISNISPKELLKSHDLVHSAQIILLPLSDEFAHQGTIVPILQNLADTLRDPNAVEDLKSLDRSRVRKRWGWIPKYFDLKPNFMGFGVDFDQLFDDLIENRR